MRKCEKEISKTKPQKTEKIEIESLEENPIFIINFIMTIINLKIKKRNLMEDDYR